jgi:hypothetical protein
MEADLTQIIEIFSNLGFSAVFLWLFVREMNRHDETRNEYHRDLREIAGLRAEHFLSERGVEQKNDEPAPLTNHHE